MFYKGIGKMNLDKPRIIQLKQILRTIQQSQLILQNLPEDFCENILANSKLESQGTASFWWTRNEIGTSGQHG
jgi:hypothetical protein